MNKRKQVLILGSKPGAKIVNADLIYAANAAAYHYRDKIDDFQKVIKVATAWLVIVHLLETDKTTKEYYFKKYQQIIHPDCFQTLVVGHLAGPA